jgi:hypothetical protein
VGQSPGLKHPNTQSSGLSDPEVTAFVVGDEGEREWRKVRIPTPPVYSTNTQGEWETGRAGNTNLALSNWSSRRTPSSPPDLIQRRVDVSHQGFGELRNDGAKTGSINVTKEGP